MTKWKHIPLCHITSFIMKDKHALGFNLSLSYLKASSRKVFGQDIENACEGQYLTVSLFLDLLFYTENGKKHFFCFLSCESLLLLQKNGYLLWNNRGYSSLKVFCSGFHIPELYQRKAERENSSRWLQWSINPTWLRRRRVMGSSKGKQLSSEFRVFRRNRREENKKKFWKWICIVKKNLYQ